MGNKAIDSLNKLSSSSVLVLLLWTLLWPSAVQKFDYYRDARDLHAWLYLQDMVGMLGWDYVLSEQELDQDIVDDCHEYTEPGFICEPIQIRTVWPVASDFSLGLHPKLYIPEEDQSWREAGSAVRIYSVITDASELPFSEYEVIFLGTGETWVVPANETELYEKLKKDSDSLRMLSIDTKNYARPHSWDSIAPDLAKFGYRQHPLSLSIQEPALEKLAVDADPRDLSVNVLGMVISLGLFVSSVGLFLGAIAFLMIGPILALQRAGPESVSHAWIMVTPTRGGLLQNLLELLLLLISIVWCLAPLALLLLQVTTEIEFQAMEYTALKVGMFGLVLSGTIFIVASLQFRACRRRKISDGLQRDDQ